VQNRWKDEGTRLSPAVLPRRPLLPEGVRSVAGSFRYRAGGPVWPPSELPARKALGKLASRAGAVVCLLAVKYFV